MQRFIKYSYLKPKKSPSVPPMVDSFSAKLTLSFLMILMELSESKYTLTAPMSEICVTKLMPGLNMSDPSRICSGDVTFLLLKAFMKRLVRTALPAWEYQPTRYLCKSHDQCQVVEPIVVNTHWLH